MSITDITFTNNRHTPRANLMVMGRTSIDIDEAACRAVMKRYALATKRQAVNLALRTLAAEPFPVEAVGALRGSAWEEIAVHAIASGGVGTGPPRSERNSRRPQTPPEN